MASNVSYHPGGFKPAAPAQNRAEQLDTATGYTRWDTAGVQVEQRALTPTEAAALAAQDAATTAGSNDKTLRDKASAALTANSADIATNDAFINIASPSNAQNAAQIKELTRQSTRQARQLNALIRLVIGQLDDITGT